MKNFALIGAAGYIAPRHVNAIKETGNNLIAALDPNDNVGYLDGHFFDTNYFSEFELFEKFIQNFNESNKCKKLDYVSICTPDYLHDSHIAFALRNNADAICEKPLVMHPKDLDLLAKMEESTGRKVNTILQLRVHPSLIKLRNKVRKENKKDKYEIEMSYVTPRGKWFFESWKGQPRKSGGVVSTIGIHFIDMLSWIFGQPKKNIVHHASLNKYGGYLELERARVKWFLSVDKNDMPGGILREGNQAYRSITIDGEEIEFSSGFKDLHTVVYENILKGKGFGIEDIRPALEIIETIRTSNVTNPKTDEIHPHTKLILSQQ